MSCAPGALPSSRNRETTTKRELLDIVDVLASSRREDRPVVVASVRELAAGPRAEHDDGHVVRSHIGEVGRRRLYPRVGQLLRGSQVGETPATLGSELVQSSARI